jgi:hypothetical protein
MRFKERAQKIEFTSGSRLPRKTGAIAIKVQKLIMQAVCDMVDRTSTSTAPWTTG